MRTKRTFSSEFVPAKFPNMPTSTHKTILTVVKCFMETSCVTSPARSGRPAKVGRQVQPDEVLAYALAYPKCSTREISLHNCLSKSQDWKILSKLDAHPYQPTPQ